MKLHLLLFTPLMLLGNLCHSAQEETGNKRIKRASEMQQAQPAAEFAGFDAAPPGIVVSNTVPAIDYLMAKQQENQKLHDLKLAESKNRAENTPQQEGGILTIQGFPRVLQQLINEYCFSPLEFLQYFYTQRTIQCPDYINTIKLSPDNKTIVSGSADKSIEIWDANTQAWTATLNGHTDAVYAIALSTDGKTIASGARHPNFTVPSIDNTIKIWDVATKRCTAALKGHADAVFVVALSTDGKTIISGSVDSTIGIWDIATQKRTATLRGHTGPVWTIALSADSKTIVSGSAGTAPLLGVLIDKTIKIWDTATLKCTATLVGHNDSVFAVALSLDGKTIVSGSGDETIKIWDIATQQCTATLTGHTGTVLTIALSADGKNIISGSSDRTIKIWDIATKSCIATLSDHNASVSTIALSTDDKTIISGSTDKTIRIWKHSKLLPQFMQLPYEQLICLKLIINIFHSTKIDCNPDHAAYYANSMQQAWASLPELLKQSLNLYFSKLNSPNVIQGWPVSSIIQKWLAHKTKKRSSNSIQQ